MAEADSIIAIVKNNALKAKEKSMLLSGLLLNKKVTIDELTRYAKTQNDVIKATLIEAIEYTTKTTPGIVNEMAFGFIIQMLKEDAPRVKWESARVIANTAHLFPKLLRKAIPGLLTNTEHSGTVVRWSAATAIAKILVLNTSLNKQLIPAAEAIVKWEKDNAVTKIYLQALKKSKQDFTT